ncbi:hypothetical protein CHLRE_02g089850v5 [Chlamydomonas reinhardtii]|uniref:FACT complex subunit SSRP1 n=1 Tax=Chlamydomonas reinhardtii TaxID=3055 RepID=A0A2K3E160_CHLRE|nr:uncharacterized protein CHLRE_02g089850v5 [Chlamydomonas reinhardtii]PNW86518.1 hypothetical protein CHLRE_02g089850v5 [Chlamydomonas reinhardtii]
MHVSNDTTVLESRKEGKSFLELVAKRISEPDLAAELISAAARLVVASASAHGKENTPVTAATYAVAAPSDASLLVKFPGLSLVAPRGKFDVGFSPEALVLSNAKSSVVVPVAAITHVAILDQIPQDTKKRCLMFVVLERNGPAVMNGKQRLEAVIIQTLETEELRAVTSKGEALDGPAAAVLCEALALVKPGFEEFIAPDPDLFRTAKGHLGVSAYVKASPGHLFPLRGGLLFAERPPMFLPLADVLAVEYRRPQSATFDLVLHVRPREGGSGSSSSSSVQQLEFSQVDKAEMGRLQSYFATCKIKLYDPAAPPRLDGGAAAAGAQAAAAAAGGSSGGAYGEDAEGDDDESDEDDEDFDPSELQRLESGRATKRQRTGASGSGAGPSTSKAAAAAAEDEDEDDEAEADDEDAESDEDEEEEDSYDEDEELADLTDEEDMAAEAVRRAARRGGQAAGAEEEDDDEDDDEDD